MTVQPQPPIFILGIARRCGTNYLSDLLALHPNCVSAAPIHEDHLLHRAHHLVGYADAVSRSWTPSWEVPPTDRARLLRSLGSGIASFLTEAAPLGARVVTKTPRVDNLDLFPELFPGSTLLLLVRDGRNVVESTVRSFDRPADSVRHDWASAGKQILDFAARHRGSSLKFQILRYEDLLSDLHGHMTQILEMCELDPAAYDFAAAEALPVRGSSTVRVETGGDVHWEPTTPTTGLRPNDRWHSWTNYEHARFAAVAGEVHRALGYDLQPASAPTITDRLRTRRDDLTWLARRVRRRFS